MAENEKLIEDERLVTCIWTEKRVYKVPSNAPLTSSMELHDWLVDNLKDNMILEKDSYDFLITEIQ